ncbi:MAG TPA: transposase [Anaerolineaceae bacterium]|nr:transposase [Anaerolineaceae bacterium]
MPNYKRNQVHGGTYFFTLVTHNREPLFSDNVIVDILLKGIRQTQVRKRFEMIAYSVLFDHLHLLLSLPEDFKSFPQIIRNIKRFTTIEVRKKTGKPELIVWQDRYWEHTIRDEEDLQHHFDYIHYNPVKHGYVEDYGDWAWSSFKQYSDGDPSLNKIDSAKFEDEDRLYGE